MRGANFTGLSPLVLTGLDPGMPTGAALQWRRSASESLPTFAERRALSDSLDTVSRMKNDQLAQALSATVDPAVASNRSMNDEIRAAGRRNHVVIGARPAGPVTLTDAADEFESAQASGDAARIDHAQRTLQRHLDARRWGVAVEPESASATM